MARYVIVDVFTDRPLAGNALAVFPDPGSVPEDAMQKIAREMNLSETTFVTAINDDGYDVRIFTPTTELPFAGHPTLGTSWTIHTHLALAGGDAVVQRSAGGETPVQFEGEQVWLERTGSVGDDIDAASIAAQLGLGLSNIGFDASAFGAAAGLLAPAVSNAGVSQMMVPVADPAVLAAMAVPPSVEGLPAAPYCFAPLGPGKIKSRFFAAGFGIAEDPGTGSAAAALGLYLGARIGACSVEITQGIEVLRPSTIYVRAEPARAHVGGSVRLAAEGTLYV
jgi:trans-2,3-dihydro-3-hydroxyanthranilate isomerase